MQNSQRNYKTSQNNEVNEVNEVQNGPQYSENKLIQEEVAEFWKPNLAKTIEANNVFLKQSAQENINNIAKVTQNLQVSTNILQEQEATNLEQQEIVKEKEIENLFKKKISSKLNDVNTQLTDYSTSLKSIIEKEPKITLSKVEPDIRKAINVMQVQKDLLSNIDVKTDEELQFRFRYTRFEIPPSKEGSPTSYYIQQLSSIGGFLSLCDEEEKMLNIDLKKMLVGFKEFKEEKNDDTIANARNINAYKSIKTQDKIRKIQAQKDKIRKIQAQKKVIVDKSAEILNEAQNKSNDIKIKETASKTQLLKNTLIKILASHSDEKLSEKEKRKKAALKLQYATQSFGINQKQYHIASMGKDGYIYSNIILPSVSNEQLKDLIKIYQYEQNKIYIEQNPLKSVATKEQYQQRDKAITDKTVEVLKKLGFSEPNIEQYIHKINAEQAQKNNASQTGVAWYDEIQDSLSKHVHTNAMIQMLDNGNLAKAFTIGTQLRGGEDGLVMIGQRNFCEASTFKFQPADGNNSASLNLISRHYESGSQAIKTKNHNVNIEVTKSNIRKIINVAETRGKGVVFLNLMTNSSVLGFRRDEHKLCKTTNQAINELKNELSDENGPNANGPKVYYSNVPVNGLSFFAEPNYSDLNTILDKFANDLTTKCSQVDETQKKQLQTIADFIKNGGDNQQYEQACKAAEEYANSFDHNKNDKEKKSFELALKDALSLKQNLQKEAELSKKNIMSKFFIRMHSNLFGRKRTSEIAVQFHVFIANTEGTFEKNNLINGNDYPLISVNCASGKDRTKVEFMIAIAKLQTQEDGKDIKTEEGEEVFLQHLVSLEQTGHLQTLAGVNGGSLGAYGLKKESLLAALSPEMRKALKKMGLAQKTAKGNKTKYSKDDGTDKKLMNDVVKMIAQEEKIEQAEQKNKILTESFRRGCDKIEESIIHLNDESLLLNKTEVENLLRQIDEKGGNLKAALEEKEKIKDSVVQKDMGQIANIQELNDKIIKHGEEQVENLKHQEKEIFTASSKIEYDHDQKNKNNHKRCNNGGGSVDANDMRIYKDLEHDIEDNYKRCNSVDAKRCNSVDAKIRIVDYKDLEHDIDNFQRSNSSRSNSSRSNSSKENSLFSSILSNNSNNNFTSNDDEQDIINLVHQMHDESGLMTSYQDSHKSSLVSNQQEEKKSSPVSNKQEEKKDIKELDDLLKNSISTFYAGGRASQKSSTSKGNVNNKSSSISHGFVGSK